MSTTVTTARVSYPPAPWQLKGQLYGSIWTVPVASCQVELPAQFQPLINFGRMGVYAGFVDYQPGSTLSYHELIAGLVIRLSGTNRFSFTVTHIWVDSEASKWGGRELWGVPKDIARFEFQYARSNRNFQGRAFDDQSGTTLAEGNFRSWVGMPTNWRLPVPFPDIQMLNGRPHRASGTFWSGLQLCQGGMKVPHNSPLAVLGVAGRRPLVSFGGLNFKMNLQAARPMRKP